MSESNGLLPVWKWGHTREVAYEDFLVLNPIAVALIAPLADLGDEHAELREWARTKLATSPRTYVKIQPS